MDKPGASNCLRVVIKDLGSLATKDDFANQQINVLVGPPEALRRALSQTKILDAEVRKNINAMRNDPNFDLEHKQICSQSSNPREIVYNKFLNIKSDEKNDILVINSDKPILNFGLEEVRKAKGSIEIKERGIILKFQSNLDILIISSNAFEKREGKGKDRDKDMDLMDDDDGEEKRKNITLKNNPFNTKLTEKDRMAFQPYHNDVFVNKLMNVTMLSSGNGKAVMEGIIKTANEFYLAKYGGDWEKNDNTRRVVFEKLDSFQLPCAGFLPYLDLEREILALNIEEQAEEKGNQQQQQQRQNQVQGNFSFNEYEIQDISFFVEFYKERFAYCLPHEEINHKLLLALNPGWVYSLFHFQPKKGITRKRFDQKELLATLNLFIDFMAKKPEVLLRYICWCYKGFCEIYHYFGNITLKKSIAYFVKLIDSRLRTFQQLIQTNDRLREMYFISVGRMIQTFNMVPVELKSEEDDEYYLRPPENQNVKEEFSEYICRELLLNNILKDVPQLQIEFFTKMFNKKSTLVNLRNDFYIFYFNLETIPKDEKIKAIKNLFSIEKPALTKELAIFVNRIILAPDLLKKISLNDLLGTLDFIYESRKQDNFMRFMRSLDLCVLHQRIFQGMATTRSKEMEAYKSANPSSYFVSLYAQLRQFLKQLESDVLIEFISTAGLLSDRKIDLLETLISGKLTKETNDNTVRKLLNVQIAKLKIIKSNIETFDFTLRKNEIYFNEYKFYVYHRDGIKDIQSNIAKYTIKQLESDACYTKSLVLLSQKQWNSFNMCQNYQLFYEGLKNKCSAEISLPEYFDKAVQTMSEYRQIFIRFSDPSKYLLSEYDKYLPRITFADRYDLYTKVMTSLDIETKVQETVFEHCKIFHSLNKVMKINQPMENLSAANYLNIKKDDFSKAINYVFDLYKDKPKDKITVADVIKNDKYKILKVADYESSPTYKMPMMLKDLAKSYDCYKFVKETADEFIKSMREEVDNEHLDVVNKLDIVNKNLKFLLYEKSFESIVKKIMMIHKDDQRKVKKFLRDLNGQIETHIKYLADKTKKDQSYNQKIIEQMMRKSIINISYAKTAKKFVVSIEYEEKNNMYTVQTVEFEEFLNKAKVIAENSSAKDEFNDLMRNFKNFGVELEQICGNLSKLKALGLIYDRCDLLLTLLNTAVEKPGWFTGANDYKNLKASYENQQGHLSFLRKANQELSNLESKLSKELVSYYSPECYLMTYFYGKKLFFLTKYLRGNATPEEQNQTLSLITEAIPRNLIDFNKREPIPANLYRVFDAVYRTLSAWSSNIKSKDKIKLNTSSVFTSKKIKTCNANLNVYRTICKILLEANESIVSLSQILFCKKETSRNEILSFCKRAMLDPFKRMYFILSIDKLDYLMVMEMKNYILKIIDSKYDNLNFNVLIFNNSGTQTKNMFDTENFENISHSLTQLDSMIKDEAFQDRFANLFKTNVIVMSEVAGMGKTKWIEQDLAGKFEKFDVFLSGEVNKPTLKRRMNHLADSIRNKEHFVLTIKLDFMEDFEYHSESIDYLLFCLSIVRRYYTDIGCIDMREHLEKIYFEVSNTFITEALTKLTFLELLNSNEAQHSQSKFKFRVVLPKFSLQDVIFSNDAKTDEQTVGRFLRAVGDGSISTGSSLEARSVSNREEYIKLLEKYYMLDITKPEQAAEQRFKSTYAQYQFWLKSMARLIKEMENNSDFKPKSQAVLSAQGSPTADSNLRYEIALEIIQFCSYIICVSVDQAKMSQDQMKEIMSDLKKHNLQKQNLEIYQQKFQKIQPWDASQLIVPLVHGDKSLFSLIDLQGIFNEEKIGVDKKDPNSGMKNPRHRKRMILRNYIKNAKKFIEIKSENPNYSNDCLTLLANFLGQAPTDLIERAKNFKGKGFVITLDNFMKISLIILKGFLKIPIVMMGESGCGKTYLSEFVSDCLLQDRMKELTLYAGVTEIDFINFMKEAVKEAEDLAKKGKNLWVFFDEFNTSSLQSIVAEIMIDRVCSIEPSIYKIPENIIFISCCNPYRMKTKKTEVGLVPKTSDTILSHRVYPIPERMLNYIWDFGQLSEADEKKHIISMVAAEKFFDAGSSQRETRFVNMLYMAHKTVRNIEERSGVSLRDIKRVLNLYRWFRDHIEFLVNKLTHNQFKKNEVHLRATICSITVAYGLRLNGRYKEQEELFKQITTIAKTETTMGVITVTQIKDTLALLSDIYLNVLLKQSLKVIPENIALNRPLKENFITMLACFDAKIPLIICGAPGTSKTLCSQIFDTAMVPVILKNNKEFESFKAINSIYYGGSQTSTSEGISKVFKRADQYLATKGEDRPVVVFDEIGLAELSPYNPLKILHPLLEKPNQEVGFFGLSNWTLDLSKMNRLIYLARPDMTKDDLVEIFKISTAGCKNDKARSDLQTYLGLLADTYLDFRQWQKANGTHPNFHGSRDIYGVSKFVFSSLMTIQSYDTQNLRSLIKSAIERNFNGAAYLFGSGENEIAWDKVPNLNKNASKGSFNNVRVEDIGNPYGHSTQGNLQVLNIFSSAQVFKQIFLNKISAKPEIADVFKDQFFEDAPAFDLITANIKDKNSRFLLVKSEGEVVDNIFMERLSKLVKPELLKDWRGIKGKENSLELLSTLKTYISLGYIVVMKNLDELYGSLYDLFNQKYLEIEGRKYCYLYFGENKHKVEVHPEFKAIILLNAESELQGLELELEQPAPFLNRFEKFFVRLANILALDDIKRVYELVCKLQKRLEGDRFKILALSIDMLTSIVLKAHKEGGDIVKESERLLMKLTTTNYLLNDGLTPAELAEFQNAHPYSNIWQVIQDMTVKPVLKTCMYTFSNPIELEYLKNQIKEQTKAKVVSSEELMNQGLEARSERIKRYDHNMLIIQFNSLDHLQLVTQLKTSISENQIIKKVLFIVHLERRAKDIELISKNIGLNFWHDWDNCVVEDINKTTYQEMKDIYDYSLTELLFGDRQTIGSDIIKESALSAFQRIIIEKNDENLKAQFQSIRDMMQNDPDNTFSSILIEKLKQSKLMESKDKWRSIVTTGRKERHTYIDVKVELLTCVTQRFGDVLKKYMMKLNEELTNLGSYATNFYNENQKIKDLYRKNLVERFVSIQLNKQSISVTKYTQTSYKLPFLNKLYEGYIKEYDRRVLVENKDSYAKLAETQRRYIEYVQSKTPNTQIIDQLKSSILNGEEFIFSNLASMLNPLLEDVRTKYGLVLEEAKLTKRLIFDLIFIMIKKWEEKTERLSSKSHEGTNNEKNRTLNIIKTKYKYFMQLCKVLSGASEADKDIKPLVSVSSVLSVCYQSDMKYIFNLIDISNIELKDFVASTDKIEILKSETNFKFKYGAFGQIIKKLQGKVIPDFKDDKVNLKFLKNRYSDMITESLKNVAKGTKDYDLKYVVILLDLIDLLPYDEANKYLTEISISKKEQDRVGGDFDIGFIKTYIVRILKVIHLIPKLDLDSLSLIISEYCNTNAFVFNFNLYNSNEFDNVFSIFDKLQQEKISSNLAHLISNNVDPFFSLRDLKDTLNSIDNSRALSAYDMFLSSIDTAKPRCFYLLTALIDKMVFNGLPQVKQLPDQEFLQIYEYLLKNPSFKQNYTGLRNLIKYAMIRLCLIPENMEKLKHNKGYIAKLDEILLPMSRSKELFIDNPDSFPFIYFLQEMICETGDMSHFQLPYRSVTNICGLVMDEDVSGSIVFFNPEIQQYYVDMNNKLSDYAYNNQLDKMTELIQRSYKGNQKFNYYVVGVVLLNKFINPVSKEDANVIQNIKNLFIKAISTMNINDLYKSLLMAIIQGDKFNFKQFLGDGITDPNYETRLKKVFFQFLLISICFDKEVGYDLEFWKKWQKGDYNNKCFKARLVVTNAINNTGSIFENIVVERLSDGSYMDYGEHYLANLGIYKCSCDYVYSIGNCGYAMVTRPCPVCGKPIGGENHQFIQRQGHEHVKSLEAFNDIIQKNYDKDAGRYYPHTAFNKSSLEATPLKLRDLGVKPLVQSIKQQNQGHILRNYMNVLTMRHMFDHMLVISLPEILPSSDASSFVSSLKGLLPYQDKNFRELYGRLAGKPITNHSEYFLAHVKNDIEVLSDNFKFRNPVMIFDYLRAVMSKIAESILTGQKMTDTNLLIEPRFLENPGDLLPIQQEIADKIRDNEMDLKSVFKNILFRNIRPGLMKNLFQKYGGPFEEIYNYMRHNTFDREHIIKEFHSALKQTTQFGLLRNLVNYQQILQDFPSIVDVNVKLPLHFNLNYDRAYNFDEATSLEVLKLEDGNMKKIYNEFERVWQGVIPRHEDKNPEVFSFAFMCQQNLNVKNFIDGVLAPGGAKLIKMLFIDPKEYSDVNLLYMNSIVRTFIDKFHNKHVDMINKVLNLDTSDEKNSSRKYIEYCSSDDYLSICEFENHVLNNFWYETTVDKENLIHFDMKRIEYLCAQDMKKPLINFDEKDIRFYNFKNTKLTEFETNLKELIKKVKKIPLSEELQKMFEDMPESGVAKSYEFILEISTYILNNFMFNDSTVPFKKFVLNKSETSLLQRFSSYDESIHSKLLLGHLEDLYTMLRNLKFDWELTHNSTKYNQELTKTQREYLMELLEDPHVEGKDLNDIKEEIRGLMLSYYQVGDQFLNQPLSAVGFDISELSPCCEHLGDLKPNQYFRIYEILNEGIIHKTKRSFVKKRSSIIGEAK